MTCETCGQYTPTPHADPRDCIASLTLTIRHLKLTIAELRAAVDDLLHDPARRPNACHPTPDASC